MEPQHGGCVSIAGDGVSGWRVEMWTWRELEGLTNGTP